MLKRFVKGLLAVTLSLGMIFVNTIPAKAASLHNNIFSDSFELNEDIAFDLVSGNTLYNLAYENIKLTINGKDHNIQVLKPAYKFSYKINNKTVVADYIVLDSGNNVLGFIKGDNLTASSIRSIFEKANEKSFTGIDAFTETAENMGINAEIVGQGLSAENLNKVAEKAIGKSISFIVKKLSGSNTYTAIIVGATTYVNSIISGSDDATTFSETTTTVANEAVALTAKASVAEVVAVAVVAIGVSEAAAPVIAFAAGMVAGSIVYKAMQNLEDELEVNETLAAAYDESMTTVAGICVDADDAISAGAEDFVNNYNKVTDDIVSSFMDGINGISGNK
jgi:hypothetical protein